ncbi:hypothetical protein QEH59_03790 [Coraliomargarita sp. SDUM461004]|uniref:SH3 domain-containing protein n=1 Tax=Thalassobacterium sedimentorum TaxID=3041258 RepID=A0ABU1AFC6_9BACT|nr:hypothetical protein [Coraliomargarita sp. SDUM461004]MDQ8193532.1 hypothetical protein [Coraliomargarita sp. SDUM461004]
MRRTFSISLLGCILAISSHAAQEILLRLQPSLDAAVIAKVTASQKVLLDTAPAPINAELGWRQIALPTPFEGYVPEATLSKNFTIIEGTPVHYLPTNESVSITQIDKNDHYEVLRVKEAWATIRVQKDITAYFLYNTEEASASNWTAPLNTPQANKVNDTDSAPKPIAFPEPVTIPAPRARINPDQPIAQLDPTTLPPENVTWQAAAQNEKQTERKAHDQDPHTPQLSLPIMVSPDQTQARENIPELGPAKTPRLLTGTLIREINVEGPGYPIRLRSPEGRLIAYVDFSKIYISDLTPYLNQKVYLRGQIYPLPKTHSQLVIQAETLRLAE